MNEKSKSSSEEESKSESINSHFNLAVMYFTQDYSAFENIRIIGNGSFGVVYEVSDLFQGKIRDTGEIVAIKKIYQDKKYKSRELELINDLKHPFIVELKSHFQTGGSNVRSFSSGR